MRLRLTYYLLAFGLGLWTSTALASVCFVTDTSDCQGGLFGNTEDLDGDGTPDNYNPEDDNRCQKEGYVVASCPEGYKPGGLKCPYDDYFTECVKACPSNYKTCDAPYFGVGEACDGKYASCDCNPCGAGYTYTSIPNGYLQDGEGCLDCDGVTKYKVKINPCDGFLDCGDMGGAAGAKTCQSGDLIKYDNCKPCPNLGNLTSCPSPFTCIYEECSNLYYKSGCQSGYDWDVSAKNCTPQCSSDYQYTCTGTHQIGGSGSSCGGKYQSCECEGHYTWNGGACSCPSSYQYTCSGTGYVGGSGSSCGGKYTSCKCANGYNWEKGSCVQNAAVWGQCTGYAGKNCKIGDILFSDGTCAADKVSGKTPIAVVVYISSEGCGQAIASDLLNLSYSWENSLSLSTTNARDNYASCENSQKIMAAGDLGKYPAVWGAHNYTTAGTKVGDWCLPASGIFEAIVYNRKVIDTGFKRASGVAFSDRNIVAWTSTEKSDIYAWILTGYGISISQKNERFTIYPVIEF